MRPRPSRTGCGRPPESWQAGSATGHESLSQILTVSASDEGAAVAIAGASGRSLATVPMHRPAESRIFGVRGTADGGGDDARSRRDQSLPDDRRGAATAGATGRGLEVASSQAIQADTHSVSIKSMESA